MTGLSRIDKHVLRYDHARTVLREVEGLVTRQEGMNPWQYRFRVALQEARPANAVREEIRAYIRFRLMHWRIHGEKMLSPVEDAPDLTASEERWLVNPLNGRKNFAAHSLAFAISLSFWEGNHPVVGATMIPSYPAFRLMSALDLPGSERKIDFSGRTSEGEKALIGGMGFHSGELDSPVSRVLFPRLLQLTGDDVRVPGSVGFGLAQVILGNWRFYFHPGPKVFDVAAALPILKVAGRYTNLGEINFSQIMQNNYRLPFMLAAADQETFEKVTEIVRETGLTS